MTKEEALELPFDEYIAWCWQYMRDACARDPMVQLVYNAGANHGGPALLEATWAKTYWFHKVEGL